MKLSDNGQTVKEHQENVNKIFELTAGIERTDDQINNDMDLIICAMWEKLEANHCKPYWDKDSLLTLAKLMQGEVDELVDAILHGSQQEIIAEAADVANFAMMIASNAKRGMK